MRRSVTSRAFRYGSSWRPEGYAVGSGPRRRVTRKNPQLMMITNPCDSRQKRRNPQLMMITNPVDLVDAPEAEIAEAEKKFKQFHMTNPSHAFEMDVPDGWPQVYIIIGEVEAFEVKDHNGKKHKKVYKGKRPIIATTADMRDLYMFGKKGLGLPSGEAVRIDYQVPADSGRNKWSSRWYHPHDTHPEVTVVGGGRALMVSGPGMKINQRGIIG